MKILLHVPQWLVSRPLTPPSSLSITLLENGNPRGKQFLPWLVKRLAVLGLGQDPHNEPLTRTFLLTDYQEEERAFKSDEV